MGEYKDTLLLPKTTFPQKLNLADDATRTVKVSTGIHPFLHPDPDATWMLHDGPPFANGDIHLGHFINKTIKDVLMRFKRLNGADVPFRPGWDCHGLPIEAIVRETAGSSLLTPVEYLKRCASHATTWVRSQTGQFQRMGVGGEWWNPYTTMDKEYEAEVLRVFATLVRKGLIYRQLRPVWWSVQSQTALAEAEIEYQSITEDSVYASFRGLTNQYRYMVWTTTPWTLPANRAIAYNPELDYCCVYRPERQTMVCAHKAVDRVFAGEEYTAGKPSKGSEFFQKDEYYETLFGGMECRLIPADYVTADKGTGLVHIAPGHGDEDYRLGIKHGLEIYCPVLPNGTFDATVTKFPLYQPLAGVKVTEATPLIVDILKTHGGFYKSEPYTHDYPHDWRSGKPVISRATTQWFVAIDKGFDNGPSLRNRAILHCKHGVDFYPVNGKARLLSMLESRPDWCISRQRRWGIPIPVFYKNGEPVLDADKIEFFAQKFQEHGSGWWHKHCAESQHDNITYETDIFDVWFESGCSWTQISKYPADMYLEGSDQHRGWFQHSLLLGLAVKGEPPFKTIVTHGFVVGPDGKKLSKRDKNYVTAVQEMDRYGADPIRLWACSFDFTEDMRTSPTAIKLFAPKYDKVRNTIRYLVSNLGDFDPGANWTDTVSGSMDDWIVMELYHMENKVRTAYEGYRINEAFQLLFNFCCVEFSSIFATTVKDRLYCEAADSPLRRRAQTALYRSLATLTRLFQPMIPTTVAEAWEAMPNPPLKVSHPNSGDPKPLLWKTVMTLRESALAQMDVLKKEQGVNKSTDVVLIYYASPLYQEILGDGLGVDLHDMVGAGSHQMTIVQDGGIAPTVIALDGRKSFEACQRCWKRREDVDPNRKLCKRCADVPAVKQMEGTVHAHD